MFGIVSLCVAEFLGCWLIPIVQQVVLPYLLHGPGVPFSLMQLGPIHLYEGHICIGAALMALLVLALIVAGIRAFTSGETRPESQSVMDGPV